MLTFFTDESSVYGDRMGQYGLTLYGGLVMNEQTFRDLTNHLYGIKRRYAFPQSLELKWRFQNVWDDMKRIGFVPGEVTKQSHPAWFESQKNDFDTIKEEILDAVSTSDARIIVAIRPNGLLNASIETRVRYSLEAVAKKFETILIREGDDFGLILADELPKRLNATDSSDYEYVINLCHDGPRSVPLKRLISIVPTINSRTSPIHQINDVLLGAMQYYALEFMRKLTDEDRNIDEAKRLFSKFAKNFYMSANGEYTINSGILIYPPKNSRMNTRAGVFLNRFEDQLREDFEIV